MSGIAAGSGTTVQKESRLFLRLCSVIVVVVAVAGGDRGLVSVYFII